MVYYSHTIISQIKAAANENELKNVINISIHDLQVKKMNGFNAKRRYMMNMMMALRYLKAEGLPLKEMNNINKAIEIFENLRKHEHENLF